jgi:hypothetical protein
MALPRGRETARLAACEKNLMQIGIALAVYDQAVGHLPLVPALGGGGTDRRDGPLVTLLEGLGLVDFAELTDAKHPPPKQPGLLPSERPIPGFVCPSDLNAQGDRFPAPISYRATTGDTPDGQGGAFAPGRRVALAEIEAGDGLSFTAAFAERLVGDHQTGTPSTANYALVPGPLGGDACPPAAPPAWRGDAGSSWIAADWRSTLYNHALLPNATPSCLAEDGRAAFLGGSSGHVNRVHVLACDGGVRGFTPRVDPKIWRGWATTHTPEGDAKSSAP